MASDSAEGGEGGLKPDPGGSRLDSVAARVRFQQEKRRNWRCPFRTRSSREAGEAPPCPSQLSGHCPGAGIFPAVFPTPPPGCAPPVLGFWCSQPSQPGPGAAGHPNPKAAGRTGSPQLRGALRLPTSLCSRAGGEAQPGSLPSAQLPGGCWRHPGSHGIFFFPCWNFVPAMGLLPSRRHRQPGHFQPRQGCQPQHGNAAGISASPDLSRSPSLIFVRERMD